MCLTIPSLPRSDHSISETLTGLMPSSSSRRRRVAAGGGYWASLPADLLVLIAEKLVSAADYFRFRSVCRYWRSAAMPPLKFSPLLLLPFDPDASSLPLFDPSDGKLYSLPLPEARHKAFLGSSHGWLALIDESAAVSLLNPFTRSQFRLPPLTPELALAGSMLRVEKVDGGHWISHGNSVRNPVTLFHMRSTFISEIMLSAPPGSGKACLILAILPKSSKIAFCQLEDAEWTLVETGLKENVRSAVCCNGRIYAVDAGGRIAACSLGLSPIAERALSPRLSVSQCDGFRILEAGESLLLVVSFKSSGAYSRFRMRYAIYSSGIEGTLEWIRVEGIEDRTLFLSGEFCWNAFCGQFSRYKKNSVYFSQPVVGITKKRKCIDHCIQVVGLANGRSRIVSCNWAVQSTRDVSWLIPHLF